MRALRFRFFDRPSQPTQPATTPARVAASAASHVELVRAPPRFEPLEQALAKAAYGARHHGSDGSAAAAAAADPPLPPPPTYASLLALTPASDAELKRELAARRVVGVPGGGVRAVEASYFSSLLDAVVATAGAAGWPLAALPTAALIAALVDDGFDGAIATAGVAALVGVCPATPPGAPPRLPPTAAADAHALRVHTARKLLTDRAEWDAPSFEAAWRDALPAGVAADGGGGGGDNDDGSPPSALATALAGQAILLPAPPPSAHPGAAPPTATVVRLEAAALPAEPGARFSALFAARPRWTRAELDPYLGSNGGWASPPGVTVEALLLAHARAAQAAAGEETFFSAR